MIFDPEAPIYNTIICYILVICLILTIRPKFMFCDKTKKFKSFGYGDNKTILSFPFVTISSGIILYMLFIGINILDKFLKKD